MKQKMFIFTIITMLFACGGTQSDEKSHNFIIATATTGGTYYPVGVALGTIITQKQAPTLTASAINSAGSGENIQMLVNKEAQLAILQGLYGAMAYKGKGTYAGQPIQNIRSITMLWENVEHFLLQSSYAKTGNIQDLQNLKQKYSIGKRGSGTEGSTRTILEALGIEPDTDFTPEYLGYSPSIQAMIDGRIAGASTPAGPPVAAVTQALAQLGQDVTLLSFTDAQLEKIRAEFPVWTAYTLPINTYPGQTEAIQTIAQPNFLACHADLPEDVIYTLTKTIYDNLSAIQNIHKATLAMKLEKAIAGLAVPLHSGAAKFYKEKGLTIPADLIAP
ncbi:MAG: TAXI family TRAP transporter solute-binding subunit [Candidatus Latescibacterota bacterium]|jgi:TRAP transporter TAXI family solute receptor